MSDLTSIEKLKLEELLEMSSGYVLDFSNRTFAQFFLETARIEIYDSKYEYSSGSKANRLRAFWQKEPNHVVGKVLASLLEYWKVQKQKYNLEVTSTEQRLYEECLRIVKRLQQTSPLEQIETIQPVSNDRDFALLRKVIEERIRDNEPEAALDRLQTFTVKYVRYLCDKHGISYEKKTPLHSLFGQYARYLRQNQLIDSPMTERILKTSIGLLEALNDIRNKHSFAHDNPILNYDESMLIFRNVTSTILFIQSVEGEDVETADSDATAQEPPDNEIPF